MTTVKLTSTNGHFSGFSDSWGIWVSDTWTHGKNDILDDLGNKTMLCLDGNFCTTGKWDNKTTSIYQWLTCPSYSSLTGYPLVSFLPFPSAVIQPLREGKKLPRKRITLPVPPSFSLGTGATAFVDTTAFSALTNFWCRSESCDTAYALFWQFHKQI